MSTPNRLSEPRSFLGTAIMFAVATGAPFLMLMWLFGAVAFQKAPTEAFLTAATQTAIFVCLVGPALGAMFHGVTVTVAFADHSAFVASANVATAQLGYHPAFHSESFLTYTPSWQAGKLAGHISIQLHEHEARIVAPRIYASRLVARLGPEASCASA